MQDVLNFLQQTRFTLAGQDISVGDILIVPTVVLVGLLLTRWLAGFISKKLKQRNVNADIAHLVRRAFYILAIVVLVITTLDLINVPITAFAFVSGAVAIGFGFGAQNIINNFISGWILMWERPIRIGDFLEVGETKGTVEAINTRSTRIRRVDGVHLLIPNSFLLENTVVNWTLVDQLMRTEVRVGVAYGSDVDLTASLIEQAATDHEDILDDPKPSVFFADFGDSALVFDVYFWINANADRDLRRIRSDLRFAVNRLFDENGIVISFPQRDVHLDGELTVRRSD